MEKRRDPAIPGPVHQGFVGEHGVGLSRAWDGEAREQQGGAGGRQTTFRTCRIAAGPDDGDGGRGKQFLDAAGLGAIARIFRHRHGERSEEHTSELQSRC